VDPQLDSCDPPPQPPPGLLLHRTPSRRRMSSSGTLACAARQPRHTQRWLEGLHLQSSRLHLALRHRQCGEPLRPLLARLLLVFSASVHSVWLISRVDQKCEKVQNGMCHHASQPPPAGMMRQCFQTTCSNVGMLLHLAMRPILYAMLSMRWTMARITESAGKAAAVVSGSPPCACHLVSVCVRAQAGHTATVELTMRSNNTPRASSGKRHTHGAALRQIASGRVDGVVAHDGRRAAAARLPVAVAAILRHVQDVVVVACTSTTNCAIADTVVSWRRKTTPRATRTAMRSTHHPRSRPAGRWYRSPCRRTDQGSRGGNWSDRRSRTSASCHRTQHPGRRRSCTHVTYRRGSRVGTDVAIRTCHYCPPWSWRLTRRCCRCQKTMIRRHCQSPCCCGSWRWW